MLIKYLLRYVEIFVCVCVLFYLSFLTYFIYLEEFSQFMLFGFIWG